MNKLHDHEELIVVKSKVINADNIGVFEPGDRLRFLSKHSLEPHRSAEFRSNKF